MKFKNIQNTDNGVKFDTEMSPQEVEYLVSWAVERLLQEGIISISGNQVEQEIELRGTSH